jgi:2-dehydropantoate 2-reductase
MGGHLFRTGHTVVLVATPQHVDAIHASGLTLATPSGIYRLQVPACKTAAELTPFQHDDVVLLTSKSQHTQVCLGQLKNAGASRTLPIVCVQNSIANEAMATRVFDRIYGMVIRVPGIFLKPGEVINPSVKSAGFFEIGRYPRGSDAVAQSVADALIDAGFAGGVNAWVMKAKAAKCLSNLVNAMGAITDSREDIAKYMVQARREAKAVWRAAGIEWEELEHFRARTQPLRGESRMPAGYEAQRNLGSSWQSLMRATGNIETEYLNGEVVKLGRRLGIPTPYNEVLWLTAAEMAVKKEQPGKHSVQDLMAMVRTTGAGAA